MKSWELEEPSVIKRLAKEKLQIVSQMFDDQTELAKLKTEYNALITEKKYNDQFNIRIIKDGDWLKNKPSVKLMELLNVCQLMVEQSKKPSLWLSLKWSFILGFPTLSLLRKDLSGFIAILENAYYEARKSEIEKDLDAITTRLHYNNLESSVKELTSSSLQLLKHKMVKRYVGGNRSVFTIKDLRLKAQKFLKEYPIVLSSTYKSNTNIGPDYVFDYVIMDEASQIDIKTGALALSCAMNAVIVGDDKQLPNVVNQEEALVLNAIKATYNVDNCYGDYIRQYP